MARIRTIKPEFFTSEDIVALSPLARLLYVALWCEADREGRMAWKPRTFKMRYLPADDCDVEALCAEVVAAGLVRLYGDGLAHIPKFSAHQHVNPREAASSLPAPDAKATRAPRVSDASARDSDAQVGKEGKEGKGTRDATRDDDPPGFADFWQAWPNTDRKQAKGKCLDAWKKAHAERDAAVIVAHVERMKESKDWQKNAGEFVPAPLVYLNQQRWDGAEAVEAANGLFSGAM